MKNIKYDTVGTIPKSNIKIVERGKIDTSNTNTDTSIKCGGVKLVLWIKYNKLPHVRIKYNRQQHNVKTKIRIIRC
jgi:hypothetical protein